MTEMPEDVTKQTWEALAMIAAASGPDASVSVSFPLYRIRALLAERQRNEERIKALEAGFLPDAMRTREQRRYLANRARSLLTKEGRDANR